MSATVSRKSATFGWNIPTSERGTRRGIIETAEGISRFLVETGYYPHISEIDTPSIDEVRIDGRTMINFSSNSFLGLCNHPEIIAAQKDALSRSGTGAGSARLVVSHSIHRELERRIARFKGREDAVIFSTGMLVNLGVIPALASSPVQHYVSGIESLSGPSNDLSRFGSVTIFLDKLSHACIYDGAALSVKNFWGGKPAEVRRYNHLDMAHLEHQLHVDRSEHKIIITDGVFSIHGRLAPLPSIVELAEHYGATVYVDDAHGTGVLGMNGRGTAEELGVDEGIDVPVGTFSKALGSAGGFVVGSEDLCRYLRIACRTAVFQTAMPPENAAGLIVALDIVERETWRRHKVIENSRYVRNGLERIGFSTCNSNHHIVPVMIGDEVVASEIARCLLGENVYAGCIRYPAVPLGEAVIRCNMMATHNTEQLDRLIASLDVLGKRFGII